MSYAKRYVSPRLLLAIWGVALTLCPTVKVGAQGTPEHYAGKSEQRLEALEKRVEHLETVVASQESHRNSTISRAAGTHAGVWRNVGEESGGIVRLAVSASAGGEWTVRAWGECHPVPCDWGTTELHRLRDDVASRDFPYALAKWDRGSAEVQLVFRLENDELVAESYEISKDSSNQTNLRSVARFRREVPAEDIHAESRSIDHHQTDADTRRENPMLLGPGDNPQQFVRPIGGEQPFDGDARLAVYVAFGNVAQGSKLLQIDWRGQVLAGLKLPYSISGLASDDARLVATVGSIGVGEGLVISVNSDGSTSTLFRDATLLPDTTAIWSSPGSREMLVADNGADVIALLPKDASTPARALLQIPGNHDNFQSMSVARCLDGSLLYSDSDLRKVFRIPAGESPILGDPILFGQAALAADAQSLRWVAALENELHVFEGERSIGKFPYPNGLTMFRSNIAFATDGTLVIGLYGNRQIHFYAANLDTMDFVGLFTINTDRVTGMAVSPRMNWNTAIETPVDTSRRLNPATAPPTSPSPTPQ